ncbi:hypothetical protein PR202_ga21256 [Eleusine coracana subsp. coracana]|uniref:Uncharacterized protein n=1 Tax=Eleusine coracana subsp. coracana TaxID=191504 RepID=A0AAV5CYN7_ELECO|nr:hypothetical protein PR202_ga21256 [Eleusine coracana subsp. coracana]
MVLAGRLVQLHLPFPPAGPERVHVRPAPRAERVEPGHGHQHARARQPSPLRRRHGHRVDHGVVDAVRPCAHERPRPLAPPPRRRVPRLRRHRPLPPEVRVQQRDSPDGRVLETLLPRAHGHVVREVAAGAVPDEEEAGRVGVPREPGVQSRPVTGPRAAEGPCERGPRVVVGRRDPVLGRQAVVHGHDERAGRRRQRVQVALVRRRGRRLRDERAAVEEHHQRQLAGGGGGGVGNDAGEVKARGEAGGGVDDDVAGGDAGGRVRRGRDRVRAHEPLHAAALVQDQEREEEEVDVVVPGAGVRGGRRAGRRARG